MEQSNIKKKPEIGDDSLGKRMLSFLGLGKSKNNSYKIAIEEAMEEIKGLPEARKTKFNDESAILPKAKIEAIIEKGRNNVCVHPDSPPSTPPASGRSSNSYSK